jgi:hypothetical protein
MSISKESPKRKYIKRIGKETDFQIILNLKNKEEVETILKMFIYLAFGITAV